MLRPDVVNLIGTRNYQIKLNSLASTLITPKAKISASDEQVLRAALNNAIACILGA